MGGSGPAGGKARGSAAMDLDGDPTLRRLRHRPGASYEPPSWFVRSFSWNS